MPRALGPANRDSWKRDEKKPSIRTAEREELLLGLHEFGDAVRIFLSGHAAADSIAECFGDIDAGMVKETDHPFTRGSFADHIRHDADGVFHGYFLNANHDELQKLNVSGNGIKPVCSEAAKCRRPVGLTGISRKRGLAEVK